MIGCHIVDKEKEKHQMLYYPLEVFKKNNPKPVAEWNHQFIYKYKSFVCNDHSKVAFAPVQS